MSQYCKTSPLSLPSLSTPIRSSHHFINSSIYLSFALSLTLLSPVCLGGFVHAQKPNVQSNEAHPYPLIWEIKDPKAQIKTSYLFGTVHVPDDRWSSLHPTVIKALKGADEVYGELDLKEKNSMMPILMQKAMLPADKNLKMIIGDALYEELDQYMQSRQKSAAFFQSMHPTMVTVMLGMLDVLPLMMSGKPVLDELILRQAGEAGKIVGGLETIEEQINALFNESEADAINSLKMTIKKLKEQDKNGVKVFDLLLEAYFKGDEELIQQMIDLEMKDATAAQKAMMDRLLNQRNQVMGKRMINKIRAQPKKSFFFACGSAHFIGPASINTALKAAGFTVTRLHAPPKTKTKNSMKTGSK